MRRREFIKSVGMVGVFSLLSTIPLHAAGNGSKSGSKSFDLMGPFDLAQVPDGDFLVSDPAHYRVVQLDHDLNQAASFGGPGSHAGLFNFPKGLSTDAAGSVYVADSNNCRIQVFDSTGKLKTVIGSIGSIGGSFATPQGVFAAPDGRLFVADTRNHRVQVFRNGEVEAVIGELGDSNDQFRLPTAVGVNSQSEILVLDSKHAMIKIFDKNLQFVDRSVRMALRRALCGCLKE